MKKSLSLILLITLTAVTSWANAASVTINNPSNPFSFTVNKGTLELSYSGASVSTVIGMDQFSGQSYDKTATEIETAFGLTPDTFDSETEVAATGSSTFKVDSIGDVSSYTIKSDYAYDYLSVHFGGYNVFFKFLTTVAADTEFTITVESATKGGGISNYRAYSTGISPVPVPAAAFLFAPALVGLVTLRRKAKKA